MHVRPNRVEYYKRICRAAGMVPKSDQGYFSRRELMELAEFVGAKAATIVKPTGAPNASKQK